MWPETSKVWGELGDSSIDHNGIGFKARKDLGINTVLSLHREEINGKDN